MLSLWQRSGWGPSSPGISVSLFFFFFFNSTKIYFVGATCTEWCQELIISFLLLMLDTGAQEEKLESEEVHSQRGSCLSALLWPCWGEILWSISPSYWQPPLHLFMGLSIPLFLFTLPLFFLPPFSTFSYPLLFAKIRDLRLWVISLRMEENITKLSFISQLNVIFFVCSNLICSKGLNQFNILLSVDYAKKRSFLFQANLNESIVFQVPQSKHLDGWIFRRGLFLSKMSQF